MKDLVVQGGSWIQEEEVCTVLGVRIYGFRYSVFYLINKRIKTSNLGLPGLSFLYDITF